MILWNCRPSHTESPQDRDNGVSERKSSRHRRPARRRPRPGRRPRPRRRPRPGRRPQRGGAHGTTILWNCRSPRTGDPQDRGNAVSTPRIQPQPTAGLAAPTARRRPLHRDLVGLPIAPHGRSTRSRQWRQRADPAHSRQPGWRRLRPGGAHCAAILWDCRSPRTGDPQDRGNGVSARIQPTADSRAGGAYGPAAPTAPRSCGTADRPAREIHKIAAMASARGSSPQPTTGPAAPTARGRPLRRDLVGLLVGPCGRST
ncbi:hypothetical protein BJ973_000799 [Actinoplanes tereljensis]